MLYYNVQISGTSLHSTRVLRIIPGPVARMIIAMPCQRERSPALTRVFINDSRCSAHCACTVRRADISR